MTTILYEHPLNERIRSYLRLEQFFVQINECLSIDIKTSHNTFFTALFAIIDTLERNDIRGDLIKDLEKLEQNLIVWSQAPEVDTSAIEENLNHTVSLIKKLKCSTPQWWQLKEDKFLSSLKQRFAIQGGNSIFDLPQLQFWVSRPITETQADMNHWLSLLDQIKYALSLTLKFIRQKCEFETIKTKSGFYQDSGEGLLLLRIRINAEQNFYPTVSGNRFRYSIRFMHPCEISGRKYSEQATSFELAKC